jgi:signal transduction histidine kinase
MEGFNKEWISCDTQHEASYTNLNPGEYTFRVKASNNDGVWNTEGTSIRITILPPWWQTWWFTTIILFSLAGLLLLIYYIRIALYRNQQKRLVVLVKERTQQLEESAIKIEDRQKEINSQNEKLMTQQVELNKHRNQLEILVEERTKELIAAKEKAEESDRLKSSFLANLSHEIRTPLNAILGFSLILGEKELSENERCQYNAIVETSSNNLLDLINDILDISKIEAGQMELFLRPVPLESVINDLIRRFDVLMKRQNAETDSNVALKVNINEEIFKTQIITDKLRVQQILSNLISNAIKFTSEGYIEVGCTKLPGVEMLEFYVKDTGIGIQEENLHLVFERFRKIEDDISQLHRGAGLGLSISFQLVNMLGGTMNVTSKFGEGSVFYFTIPFIKSDTPFIAPKISRQTDMIPDLSDCTILVAEDDSSSFSYIEKLLKKTNANISHALNGKEVLSLLQKHNEIDLILMDIKMPVMDGIEALHEIRKMNIQIPVIAQTAYTLANEVVKLKNEGFDEYISKPVNPENFYRKIAQFMKID